MIEAYEGQHSYNPSHRPNDNMRNFIHSELRLSCCLEAPFVYWNQIEAAIRRGDDPVKTADVLKDDYWTKAEAAMLQGQSRRDFLRNIQRYDRSLK